ncbi:hypothetical protein FRX31_032323 [Thalictrum thalictroides]|uniref:Uncharacterized protein n=1 Tax=Thalictrum thalictroides TaxID=46969 RepID=A0A7J6V040_THATH|nr:hypothetical protein FRX31_032323 [Thalictrum thalictroides]
MEYLKLAEEKGSPKRESKISKARSQKSMRCSLLEAIAQVHGGDVVSRKDEDGIVRMKIVVKKQDLKQLLEMIGGGTNESRKASTVLSAFSSILTLEQRLNIMRRRHMKRAERQKGCASTWRPVLQSIPE